MVPMPEQSVPSMVLIGVGVVAVLASAGLSLLKAARLSALAGATALVVGSFGVVLAQADLARHDRAVQDYMEATYGLTVTTTEAHGLSDGATVVVNGGSGKTERLRLISPDRPDPILVKVAKDGASGDTVRPKAD